MGYYRYFLAFIACFIIVSKFQLIKADIRCSRCSACKNGKTKCLAIYCPDTSGCCGDEHDGSISCCTNPTSTAASPSAPLSSTWIVAVVVVPLLVILIVIAIIISYHYLVNRKRKKSIDDNPININGTDRYAVANLPNRDNFYMENINNGIYDRTERFDDINYDQPEKYIANTPKNGRKYEQPNFNKANDRRYAEMFKND